MENVSSVYISQEYIDELTYNSKSNVYFVYTLEEIDAVYQGTRYVFTMSEEGDTIAVPFEEYDDTFEQVIKDVSIGTGVILICVTVSVVSGGAGALAVSMIFAASAKSGTIFALSSGGLSGEQLLELIEMHKESNFERLWHISSKMEVCNRCTM